MDSSSNGLKRTTMVYTGAGREISQSAALLGVQVALLEIDQVTLSELVTKTRDYVRIVSKTYGSTWCSLWKAVVELRIFLGKHFGRGLQNVNENRGQVV